MLRNQLGKISVRHLECARLLIESRANVNRCCDLGQSPLWVACQRGHLEVVRLLLESKADKAWETSGKRGFLHGFSSVFLVFQCFSCCLDRFFFAVDKSTFRF